MAGVGDRLRDHLDYWKGVAAYWQAKADGSSSSINRLPAIKLCRLARAAADAVQAFNAGLDQEGVSAAIVPRRQGNPKNEIGGRCNRGHLLTQKNTRLELYFLSSGAKRMRVVCRTCRTVAEKDRDGFKKIHSANPCQPE